MYYNIYNYILNIYILCVYIKIYILHLKKEAP